MNGEAERRSQVWEETEALTHEIDQASNLVNTLLDRLSAFALPEPPRAESEKKDEIPKVRFAGELRTLRRKVMDISSAVDSMLGRLEI